jgi:hypothetical protein
MIGKLEILVKREDYTVEVGGSPHSQQGYSPLIGAKCRDMIKRIISSYGKE